jgi:hypothetical protein
LEEGGSTPSLLGWAPRYDSGSSPGGTQATQTAWIVGTSSVVGFSSEFDGSNTVTRGYVNGTLDANTGSASGSQTVTFDEVAFGVLRANGSSFNFGAFNTPLGLVFNRRLSDSEFLRISKNPWQLFEPETIWVPQTSVTIYRPGTDITVTGWTGTPNNANLSANINESAASDAEYITSPDLSGGTPGPFIGTLNGSVPVGTWDVRFRGDYTSGSARQIKFTLLDGSNASVGAGSFQTLTTSFALYTSTITTTGIATRFKIEVQ